MGNRYTIDEWNDLLINNIEEPVIEPDVEIIEPIIEPVIEPDVEIIEPVIEPEVEIIEPVVKNASEKAELENRYYDVDDNDSPEELVRKLRHNAEIHRIKIMNSGNND